MGRKRALFLLLVYCSFELDTRRRDAAGVLLDSTRFRPPTNSSFLWFTLSLFKTVERVLNKTNWWRPATFYPTQQSVAKKNGPFFPSTSLHVLKSISDDFLEDKSHLTVSAFHLLLLFVISLHLLMYTFPYFVFWWGLYSLDGDLDPSASAALPFSVQPRLMFLTLSNSRWLLRNIHELRVFTSRPVQTPETFVCVISLISLSFWCCLFIIS